MYTILRNLRAMPVQWIHSFFVWRMSKNGICKGPPFEVCAGYFGAFWAKIDHRVASGDPIFTIYTIFRNIRAIPVQWTRSFFVLRMSKNWLCLNTPASVIRRTPKSLSDQADIPKFPSDQADIPSDQPVGWFFRGFSRRIKIPDGFGRMTEEGVL